VRVGVACEAGPPPAEVLDLLEAAGLPGASLRGKEAPALLRHAAGAWFLGSAADVLRACDRGALDAGIVGSDRLLEGRHGVADLLDLRCCPDDLVFAVTAAAAWSQRRLRIATRHPETTRSHFAASGAQPEIVTVDEPALAPGLGLADGVVELRSRLAAGRAGMEDLQEREVVAACGARFVVARAARVLLRREVNELVYRLRAVLEGR
jgi:ATP phosphoribosyltransferase